MADRITNEDLQSTANALTHAARKAKIIEPYEKFIIDGAYGGVRLIVTGDTGELAARFGADRDNWPSAWSGVRQPIYGMPTYYDTKRNTYNAGTAVLAGIYATLDTLGTE